MHHDIAGLARVPLPEDRLAARVADPPRRGRKGLDIVVRQQRPDGLEGLLKTYGLSSAGDAVTMDLGLLYSALESRKVDMIAANSTDGPASGTGPVSAGRSTGLAADAVSGVGSVILGEGRGGAASLAFVL